MPDRRPAGDVARPAPAGRRPPRWLALALLLFVSFELGSGVALWALARLERMPPERPELSARQRSKIERLVAGQTGYIGFDAELGWVQWPGGENELYRANAQGFRADREHPASVPSGRLRIASFGDSFTHGDDVPFADTWQEQLAARVPGLDVLNFGVPGYGPDQALLRYEREAPRFAMPVVLFGIMTTDIRRTVNRFRAFTQPGTGFPMGKPRFRLRDGELELLENPLPTLAAYQALLDDERSELRRIGQDDYQYGKHYATRLVRWPFSLRLALLGVHVGIARGGPDRPIAGGQYNEGSEAFRVLLALCERFDRFARARGSEPVVVMLPTVRDMREMRREGRGRYAPLLARLAERGIRAIDLAPAFAARPGPPAQGVMSETRHYNATGNEVVAGGLHQALVAEGLLPAGP